MIHVCGWHTCLDITAIENDLEAFWADNASHFTSSRTNALCGKHYGDRGGEDVKGDKDHVSATL